jgi:uncharacterized membrane protein YeaQ/YmgE (transglycosylase-associated protein family)
MSILGWIIFGAICGFLASKIVRGQGAGCMTNIALGLLGAIVGGTIFSALTRFDMFEFNLTSMFVATIGAIIVLYGYYAIKGHR